MEDYSVAQQIYLFRNAEYIIGPSGASWANIIFCNPRCKALSWLPSQLSNFSAYSTLAHITGVTLKFFSVEPINVNELHSNYKVNVDSFYKQLESLIISE